MTVISHQVELSASPSKAFEFLHDPSKRQVWDISAERATLDQDKPGKGVGISVTGKRMAPSWQGRYTTYDPPKRSVLEVTPGAGMPFRSYNETIELRPAPKGGGSILRYTIEYQTSGMWRLIEPFTVGSRLRRTAKRSVSQIYDHFL